MRAAFFLVIVQWVVVISYQRFVTERSRNVGADSCPETSARNYHYLLRNNRKERSSLQVLQYSVLWRSGTWAIDGIWEENWEAFFPLSRFMCYDLFIAVEPVWSVGIAASYRPSFSGFEFQQEQEIFPFYKSPVRLWGPLGLLFGGYRSSLVDRDSSVGIATRYGLDGPGIETRWEARFFRTRPYRLSCPPSLLYKQVRGLSRR